MEINGRVLQKKLLEDLKITIANLKARGVTPGIAIVTLGSEETWEAYVNQKIKLADELGVKKIMLNLRPKSTGDVLAAVRQLNEDPTIHGLIVQRPFPTYIDTERIIQSVSKEKDIDGFRKDSLFEVPVFMAVRRILTQACRLLGGSEFQFWLSQQSVLIVGKGETAGNPVRKGLEKLKIKPTIMDSKTSDRSKLFENATVIIFATGKGIAVPYKRLKKNCILIGIGLHRNDSQLTGDFDDNEAKNHGLYYTPSPGGVGPLNLFYLFENLVHAASRTLDKEA